MKADHDSLIETITEWHENNEHDRIIEAVLEIPEEERGYELTCLLARAYNNTDEYEKALGLLLMVKDEGKYDLMWHFRTGYAYYYLDALELAEKSFERVLESDPGNTDAGDFLGWIREEIKEAAEIKPKQEKAALEEMIRWLSHENELGQAPAQIEQAGEFDLHGYHYYIYKYKKNPEDSWLIGVCGGYGRRDLDHCGHVFSEMEEYLPETAEEKAVALIEMLREAWMNEARKEMETLGLDPDSPLPDTPGIGPFTGFVLLDSLNFDAEQIKAHLKNDWDILFRDDIGEPDVEDGNSLVLEADGMIAAISLIEVPVPGGEAEHYAAANYMWPDAVEVTKTHKAQILVAVLNREQSAIDAATLFTKVASCCLKLENAVGIYTSGTVFPPDFYIDIAGLINDGDLPILDWIYFGIYTLDQGTCAYTYGMTMFGKEEIEIINSTAMPEAVHDMMIDIVYYVLSGDIMLKDGETIGFTEFQKLKITRSKGIFVDGYSLKIEY